jgi:hypothetical protein
MVFQEYFLSMQNKNGGQGVVEKYYDFEVHWRSQDQNLTRL